MSFFHNVFLRPSVLVLTPKDPPVFSVIMQKAKVSLREKLVNWRPFSRKKIQKNELEIPRDLL
jgi:hypothetical protein